jgi:hypothetical protein
MSDREGERGQPQQSTAYCITSIDKRRGTEIVAAGMTFQKAVELKQSLANRFPDVAFVVEPEPDPSKFTLSPPVYQIIGVNDDHTRTVLMHGMTLEQAESTRDALLDTGAFVWIWIEREPIQG